MKISQIVTLFITIATHDIFQMIAVAIVFASTSPYMTSAAYITLVPAAAATTIAVIFPSSLPAIFAMI
jgi:hypothetical protein